MPLPDLTSAQTWATHDPRVQAILNDPTLPERTKRQRLAALSYAEQGGQTPSGYYVDPQTGAVREGHDWNPRATLPVWAGMVGLGAAGGAFSGLGAAAGTGGGAGGAGGGAGGAGGTLASQQIGNGFIPAITGGTGLPLATLASQQIGNGFIPPITGDTGLQGVETGTDLVNDARRTRDAADKTKDTTTGGGGFSVEDLLKLLVGGGSLLGGALQNRGPSYPPEMDALLKLQRQRMEQQDPLYQSILQLSKSRMPTAAQG